MQKKILPTLICALFLLGCSSKPEIGDIEQQLKEGWSVCEGLKMSNLKKINGVDNGNFYTMEISYNLTMTKDFSSTADNTTCPTTDMLNILYAYAKRDGKLLESLKFGDVINVVDSFKMVKSEKGWISQ